MHMPGRRTALLLAAMGYTPKPVSPGVPRAAAVITRATSTATSISPAPSPRPAVRSKSIIRWIPPTNTLTTLSSSLPRWRISMTATSSPTPAARLSSACRPGLKLSTRTSLSAHQHWPAGARLDRFRNLEPRVCRQDRQAERQGFLAGDWNPPNTPGLTRIVSRWKWTSRRKSRVTISIRNCSGIQVNRTSVNQSSASRPWATMIRSLAVRILPASATEARLAEGGWPARRT